MRSEQSNVNMKPYKYTNSPSYIRRKIYLLILEMREIINGAPPESICLRQMGVPPIPPLIYCGRMDINNPENRLHFSCSFSKITRQTSRVEFYYIILLDSVTKFPH